MKHVLKSTTEKSFLQDMCNVICEESNTCAGSKVKGNACYFYTSTKGGDYSCFPLSSPKCECNGVYLTSISSAKKGSYCKSWDSNDSWCYVSSACPNAETSTQS